MGDKAEKKPKVIHGVEMTPYGVFRFAQTYRVNADALALAVAEIGPQMSDHPRRFLYFQALENFLRSFLLLGGKTPEEVRDYNHNFAGMLDDSKALGLELPTEAEDCIRSRTLAKEYVRIRYDYKLDDENEPWVAAKTLEQLQRVVSALEKVVDQAIQASNPEFIMLGDIKLTKIAGYGP